MPKLDEELSGELIQLKHDYESESETPYLAVVERCAKLRALVKGNAADWYNDKTLQWEPWETHHSYNADDERYTYNINFSQAWWQILQSAMETIGIPGAVFRPQNPQQQIDKAAAAIGKRIIDYQRTRIDFRDLMMGIYRLCYTDGIVLALTRHVKDASKYGETNIPIELFENRVVKEAGFKCFECGMETDVNQVLRDPNSGATACLYCGSPLREENFTDVQVGPVKVGEKKNMVPNGREIVDLYGALESLLPWWAKDLEHSPYAMIKTGMPKEEVIAAFPDLEDDIEAATSDNKIGTLAREQARAPQDSSGIREKEFPTYSRVWFRPSCFYRIGDKLRRAKLLELYPDGVFFQLLGDVFLDTDKKRGCWNEKLEARLDLIRPFKGDGMYTPSIGQSGVPIHESAQTAWNMALEAMEHCAFPQGLIDSEVIKGEGIKDTRVRPGTWKEIILTGGKKLRESWDQMKSEDISASVQSFIAMAQPMGEFHMGTVNALQGQPITNVRTASGQAQSRTQGLQRQAPTYGAVKIGLAGIQGKLVNEFLQNQNAETYYEVTGETGEMEERKIELGPERGHVVAYPEVSEAIPQTWAQKQETINRVLESQSPVVQGWTAHPKNARLFFDDMGLPELTVPGKELADKYEKIIQELLESDTTQEPVMDENGQPKMEFGGYINELMQPDRPVTTPGIARPFDPVLDNPDVALAVIQEWAAGKEGMTAQRDNPTGFANVRMFAQQAQQALAAAQPQEPPKPPDPQKMEITQLVEENKRALAQMRAQSEEASEQLRADTEKWLEEREGARELVMQRRQQAHERNMQENEPESVSQ